MPTNYMTPVNYFPAANPYWPVAFFAITIDFSLFVFRQVEMRFVASAGVEL